MDNKKMLVALALVVLVGIVGGTFAYFTSTATLNNEFVTGTYSTSVKEEFVSPSNWTPGTTTKKKVNVTNNGSVDIAVRAVYYEKWIAADGKQIPIKRDGQRIAQFVIGSDWQEATDGYYYYNKILKTNETSTDFLSSVVFNPNFELEEGTDIECTTTKENDKTTVNCINLTSGYAGATYSLDIVIETIQADQIWSYDLVEPAPALISFTISGTTYTSPEGWTWTKWINSDYNTIDGLAVDSTGKIINFNMTSGALFDANYKRVTGNQVIASSAYRFVHAS